jgi:hypothetical protein
VCDVSDGVCVMVCACVEEEDDEEEDDDDV